MALTLFHAFFMRPVLTDLIGSPPPLLVPTGSTLLQLVPANCWPSLGVTSLAKVSEVLVVVVSSPSVSRTSLHPAVLLMSEYLFFLATCSLTGEPKLSRAPYK